MIFIINLDAKYPDLQDIFFVKAPIRFEKWYDKIAKPIFNQIPLSQRDFRNPRIIATSKSIDWKKQIGTVQTSMSPGEFLLSIFPTGHNCPKFQ